MTQAKIIKRMLTGKVVSNKMQDTIVVLVENRVRHPKYGKFIRRSNKIHAHDAQNQCELGDVVVIGECRPISRKKKWTLVQVKERAENE